MQLFINLGNLYEALGNAYNGATAKVMMELLYDNLYEGNTAAACDLLDDWKQDCIANSQVCKHLRDTMNTQGEKRTAAEEVRSNNHFNWKIRYYATAVAHINTVINDLSPLK